MFTSTNAVLYYVFKMFTDWRILLTKMSVKISMKKTTEQGWAYVLNFMCNLQQPQICWFAQDTFKTFTSYPLE